MGHVRWNLHHKATSIRLIQSGRRETGRDREAATLVWVLDSPTPRYAVPPITFPWCSLPWWGAQCHCQRLPDWIGSFVVITVYQDGVDRSWSSIGGVTLARETATAAGQSSAMIRFRGLPTSPSQSPTRAGSLDPVLSRSGGHFLDSPLFRGLVLVIALIVIWFLPYLLVSNYISNMEFSKLQPVNLSQYCQVRYSNNTLDLGDSSYFIALNLHNNDEVAPYILPQLQRLVDVLGPQRVFVSIYESGSVDSTRRWVLLYRQFLQLNDIPHEIVSDDRMRASTQHRIDFLATVRNTVMAPLYTGKFKADYVVFVNDVFFCAEDVSRLAQRVRLGTDVSMACGLDLCEFQRELIFYDTWVTRDMTGAALDRSYPFFSRKSDVERIQRGHPIPVYACWNGLVVIDASVFSKIRFRSAPGDACVSSECDLFCQDVWQVAPGNIMIDPAVNVVYEKKVAERLLAHPFVGIGRTDVPVLGTFPEHEPRPTSYQCFPMRGRNSIASPQRWASEPVTRPSNSFWSYQKLYLNDQ